MRRNNNAKPGAQVGRSLGCTSTSNEGESFGRGRRGKHRRQPRAHTNLRRGCSMTAATVPPPARPAVEEARSGAAVADEEPVGHPRLAAAFGMPLRASTCSYVAEWAAPIGRQRPFRRRQPTSDQEMERTGPCCFFWWCPPSQTAWLRVACALLLLCALLEEGEARRRRIFDDCPESRLPVAEADLVITATVERLLQDGAQVRPTLSTRRWRVRHP
ncbi:hypothetical protein MTO96_038268 [Rhipicephalus appendiculatus]